MVQLLSWKLYSIFPETVLRHGRMRRLFSAIHERLPFRDEQSGPVITADVIIDNRGQLFEQLEVVRDRKSGMTDSELILLAYLKWGPETPRFLIGDFAFVIWDASRKLAYLQRLLRPYPQV
jgi:asparagine synthetase B (glutamine-hydrolysing)